MLATKQGQSFSPSQPTLDHSEAQRAVLSAPYCGTGTCIKHHKQFRATHTRPPQCLLFIIKRVKHVYCIMCEHNILSVVNNSLCSFWLINQGGLGNPLPLSSYVQMGPLPRANSSCVRDVVSDVITFQDSMLQNTTALFFNPNSRNAGTLKNLDSNWMTYI